MIKYIAPLFLFCLFLVDFCSAETISRYRIDTSNDTIAKLQWNIGKGLYGHRSQLLKLSSPDIDQETAEELYRALNKLSGNTLNLQLDEDTLDFNPKNFIRVLNRIRTYVDDSYHDGSIEYSYSITYDGWIVHRYVYIEDNKLISRVSVSGNIYSRVDKPRVYTSITGASLEIVASETDRTNIKTTMSLKVNQSYCAKCGLVRRLSARFAPQITHNEVSSQIDSTLNSLASKVKTLAQEGRDTETIIDIWLDTLHDIRVDIGPIFRR